MIDQNEHQPDRAEALMAGIRTGVSNKLGDLWWSLLVRGILAAALGIFAFFWPALSLSLLVLAVGLYCVADGIAGLIAAVRASERRAYLLQALMSLAIGAVLVFWPGGSVRTLLVIFGIWVILMGISQIMAARRLTTTDPDRGVMITVGLVATVAGVVLMFLPGSGVVVISWVIALVALLVGALLIYLASRFRRLGKRIETRHA
jgi:uncharacterized membrane protein HdeD (DUF308 family)